MSQNLMLQGSYPPQMDALTAAPEHHRLLFDNDYVQVINTRIPPGALTLFIVISGRQVYI